jgi:hypothetical protein
MDSNWSRSHLYHLHISRKNQDFLKPNESSPSVYLITDQVHPPLRNIPSFTEGDKPEPETLKPQPQKPERTKHPTHPVSERSQNAQLTKTNISSTSVIAFLTANETHSFLYIIYKQGTHTIQIKGTSIGPEFPSIPLLLVIMSLLLMMSLRWPRRILCKN